MAKGDIILYRTDGNRWNIAERAIVKFTRGPFVHVSIDCGDGYNIAAHPRGITKERNPIYGYVLVPTSQHCEPHAFADAWDYIHRQLGKRYGWFQIIDYAFGILGLPLYFFEKDHNDCSTLVAKYLCRLNPDYCFDNPDLVSPNDLARFFKIIQ